MLTNKPFSFSRFQSHHLDGGILVVSVDYILNVAPNREDWTTKQENLEATFSNHTAIRYAFIVDTSTLKKLFTLKYRTSL